MINPNERMKRIIIAARRFLVTNSGAPFIDWKSKSFNKVSDTKIKANKCIELILYLR